jgi:hypothetical protein
MRIHATPYHTEGPEVIIKLANNLHLPKLSCDTATSANNILLYRFFYKHDQTSPIDNWCNKGTRYPVPYRMKVQQFMKKEQHNMPQNYELPSSLGVLCLISPSKAEQTL